MPEAMDRIDWGALRHAHGPATDVPRHLEGLVSPDAGDREAALEALYASLWCQGTLWPATAAAIPFLLELVKAEGTPDRQHLLLYLADVGRAAAMGDDPWYADTATALAAGVPILAARLDADDEVERISAAVALAWADDGTVLTQRLKRGDEGTRLVTLYALVAGRAAPDPAVLKRFADSDEAGVALIARIGLARSGTPIGEISPDGYALLAEVAATIAPQALPQPVELFDPSELSPTSVRSLAAVLRSSHTARPALALVEALLEAAFPDGYEEPITALQKEVLGAIAASPGAWTFDGNTLAALSEHGVDTADRDDLCARIGLDHVDDLDDDDTQSLLAGSEDTGIRYEELTTSQKGLVEQFVAYLDDKGWNESRNWHAFVTSGSGYAISPIAVGRHFNEKAVLECTLWFFDEHHAADTGGERIGDPYVRLLIAEKSEESQPIGFRGFFADGPVPPGGLRPSSSLEAVLDVVDKHRKSIEREAFGPFLHDWFQVCPKVEVELADGRVAEIRPKQ